MKSSAVMGAVLLIFLVSSAAALNCFQCSNCGDSYASEQKCLHGFDACMTFSVGNRVSKSCYMKIACEALQNVNLGAVQTALRKLFGSVSHDISEKDLKGMEVNCCQGDYCNGATSSIINPLILFLPTIMFLIRF